jgi:hypothetical protein
VESYADYVTVTLGDRVLYLQQLRDHLARAKAYAMLFPNLGPADFIHSLQSNAGKQRFWWSTQGQDEEYTLPKGRESTTVCQGFDMST